MVWCSNCAKNIQRPDYVDGKICCSLCGRVLDEDNFSSEPTFSKNAAGQIAVERNFTRGRRKEQVEAACLYIACRENKKPYLLIDFSEYLRINVYILGAVFLQLCKLLSLEEHPIVQKPVDPSLFIHRFTDRLFGGRKPIVSRTALHIVASMKRDWMQTGRKPSGLCGAALYISALSHGLKCSKSDIIKVVHVCEATLTKRLIEFENTESGSLTIEEFNMRAEELEKEERLNKQLFSGSQVSEKAELLCEHKGSGKPPFAHGLCESCYSDFVQLSGGLDGGSEPPAFQRAERERLLAKEAACTNCTITSDENNNKDLNSVKEGKIQNGSGIENSQLTESEAIGAVSRIPSNQESDENNLTVMDSGSPDGCNESESFSDIDDLEVDGYLHNEEEKHYKKIIWEQMNKEYLEEQAAKEAAAEAARKAFEANLQNCSEDMQAAQKLAAAASAAVAKSRKERQQKRAAELRNLGPAQTAAEATRQMLTRKRLSSKINYDVLDKLFEESVVPDNSKRTRSTIAATPGDDKLPDDCRSPALDDNWEADCAAEGEDNLGVYYDDVQEEYAYDDTFDDSHY
ncbi:transcription factor IIIB 60 kDa subunit isoform X2 [Coffea arabica]|uniref:Transcription factor IIIB 60 kDa subunit isoform X2 n=1 Tax=Coffea arabica TaxID=13443 RepID=A0A6P6SS38_COFAR|nr:transcription factor IIIB 90 kDa subunit-like isoform X2 [Coffea arabica]